MRPLRFVVAALALAAVTLAPSAPASHTPEPTSVTIAGSLQQELGCPGDWQPECATTHLAAGADDGVWQGSFSVLAGDWEYKAALNDGWAESYPGGNVALSLPAGETVKFFYDHETHWVADNVNDVVATVPGSFQSELGCPSDWSPDCLRSWLQDPDGDGIYSFTTGSLIAGSYEAKVAIDEGWAENYGTGGVPNGPNIPFVVAAGDTVTFTYDAVTHVLDISVDSPPAGPSVTIAGSLQSELGCPGDWQPECAATHLVYEEGDAVWQQTFDLPAGDYEYKAALNGTWDENYGANAQLNGPNIPLDLPAGASVKFYFDPVTHWVTSNRNAVIAVAPGSFQSELGCSGDWQPDCLRSWLHDIDGDGIYERTVSLPAGDYEVKVAIGETWDENYGAGGSPGGANIAFMVAEDGNDVTFSYDAATHVLTVLTAAPPLPPGDVEWDGLRHDSRDPLYRTPVGAVEEGTPVRLRFRTFHDDVTGVTLRLYDVNANAQQLLPMALAAEDVSCYQAGVTRTCDFWEVVLPNADANNIWYRFVVAEREDVDYYADNTPALDGGQGAASEDPVDDSWALTIYEPGFATPEWARSAFVYQIFPDRFRNGSTKNDPVRGSGRFATDPRYGYPPNAGDQVVQMRWNELPEGYCRNYAVPLEQCQERFPQSDSDPREGPRGRDYFGGDLAGVTEKLDYLKLLGVTAIYFNPIFDSGSNHGYDTQDYTKIDRYFGELKDFEKLEKEARKRGIRLILDGVFNHMSSDSAFFDRYGHYSTIGACESESSEYRSWFTFHPPGNVCANAGSYDSWFGFDSIPTLTKTLPAVQSFFLTSQSSIAKLWLRRGADAWRLDVSGDASFPSGYWETFKAAVEATSPDALTISETWQKDTALLRSIRGDRLDTTMNYRLRDAVLGLLAPGSFDTKGFADSGRTLSMSEFASRLESVYEDYAPAAAATLMNLLDSHDTERILWTLTPGDETRAAKEQNADNKAEGRKRLKLASLIQFGVPGMPTVFYGGEVGLTGDDDPDDRRPYPWLDKGGKPDAGLFVHYTALSAVRRLAPALTAGAFDVLHVSDADGTFAFARTTGAQRAIVAINRSDETHTIDLSAHLRPTVFPIFPAGTASLSSGVLTLGPKSGAIVVSNGDYAAPAAPAGLVVTGEGDSSVSLSWSPVAGATYDVYGSPLRGGGYVKLNDAPLTATSYTDDSCNNATTCHYVVRAVDSAGNASEPSNEVSALPHLTIGWANTQWPPSMTHTISAVDRTDNVYGQVWIDGATEDAGPTPSLRAQLGFGPDGSNPTGPLWTWVDAEFNVQAGNNDEFVASLQPETTGELDYLYRYSTTGGRDWLYAGLDGPGTTNRGALTVDPSGDATAPAVPAGLHVVTASPAGVELAWDAVLGDASLYGYEVLRDGAQIARVTTPAYTDVGVVQGETYEYAVRSVDRSFNRSAASPEVSATADLRTVSLTFNVTVPPPTGEAVGRSVYIAGFLNRLDGGLPEWNPGGVVLTRVSDTLWTIALTGKEFTQLEYKYTLGDWEHVEKDEPCGEIANRRLTLAYGTNGTQTVSDTVPNWRNVTPCGN